VRETNATRLSWDTKDDVIASFGLFLAWEYLERRGERREGGRDRERGYDRMGKSMVLIMEFEEC
jgi:hypothetical protein